jgi:hypothetical protein
VSTISCHLGGGDVAGQGNSRVLDDLDGVAGRGQQVVHALPSPDPSTKPAMDQHNVL